MPYETTKVSVRDSRSGIEKTLNDRGVTDTRFTMTATLFAVEFNWALRRGTGRWCSGSWTCDEKHGSHSRHQITEVRGVLGVRIVAPWSDDEKDQRRIARVLYWHIKSKIEIVESGAITFEQEFLPHLTLGRGRTVYDEFKPMLDAAIEEKKDLSVAMEGIAGQAMHKALPEGAKVKDVV